MTQILGSVSRDQPSSDHSSRQDSHLSAQVVVFSRQEVLLTVEKLIVNLLDCTEEFLKVAQEHLEKLKNSMSLELLQ